MNFYEILKTKKLGRGSPDYWTQLFAERVGEKGEWAVSELTGTLPMTFRSNGTALIDYRIYGTADGAGVQTENLFNYVSYFASITTYNRYFSYANIQLSPNTTYTLSTNFHSGTSGSIIQSRESPFIVCNTVDSPSTLTGGFGDDRSVSVTTTDDGIIELYVRISRGDNPEELCDIPILSDFENGKWVMIVEGSTPPETYIPHGYKLHLTVTRGTESKDTDIYIGGSKLGEAEYVDYGEQKIYKRILFMTHDNKQFITKDNKDFCLRRRGYSG